jgi:hypothetical protein
MGEIPLAGRLRRARVRPLEISDLEAYRREGTGVHDALAIAEARRQNLISEGANAWEFATVTQVWELANWCAFATQRVGEVYMDSFHRTEAENAELPLGATQQLEIFFREVERWIECVNRVEDDSSYLCQAPLPCSLPPWIEVRLSRTYLGEMLAACNAIVTHAASAVADLDMINSWSRARKYSRLCAELTRAQMAARYATIRLDIAADSGISQIESEIIELIIKTAIELAFRIGQLAALPQFISELGEHAQLPGGRYRVDRYPGPSESGFDLWRLTDPATQPAWEGNELSLAAIQSQWLDDPDPAATLAIQAEIDAALARGDIERMPDATYHTCPWSAIYLVVNPVTIGEKSIRRGATFTLDITYELTEGGVRFSRDVLVADFPSYLSSEA